MASLLGPTPRQGPERRAVHPETGRLSFLGFDPGQGPTVPGFTRGMSAQAQARAGFGRYAAEFGIRDPNRELQVMEASSGARSRVRYQQVYDGVPVVGGELVVNVRADGELSSISGEVSPDLTLEVTPQIDAEQARATALEAVAKYQEVSTSSLRASPPELWIYDARLLAPSDRPPELVWRTEVRARGKGPIRELVLVNAITGGVSLHFNQVDLDSGGELDSPLRQDTDTPTATETETPTDTGTPTDTPTDTPTPTDTDTPADTPTNTLTPSDTATETVSPTASDTPTATGTPTWTPNPTEPAPVLYFDMVLDEGRGLIYASNRAAGTIEVFSLTDLSWITSVTVGSEPTGIDMKPDGSELAVALYGGGRIAFMSLESRTIVATVVPAGVSGTIHPYDVLYGRPGRVYAVGTDNIDYLHVIDSELHVELGRSSRVVRANPRLTITGDKNSIYVSDSDFSPQSVSLFDIATDTPAFVTQAPHGDALTVTSVVLPDGSKVFTSRGQVWTGDLSTLLDTWVDGGDEIEYVPLRGVVAVSNRQRVTLVDVADYSVTRLELFVDVGVARATSDGTRLIQVTALGLLEIDLDPWPVPTMTPAPLPTVTAQPAPGMFGGLVIDDARGLIYGSNGTSDTIDIHDLNDLHWIASLEIGPNPRGIAITPDGRELVVAVQGGSAEEDGWISFIDLDTWRLAARLVPAGNWSGNSVPMFVEFGRPGRLYASVNARWDYVRVLDPVSHEELAMPTDWYYDLGRLFTCDAGSLLYASDEGSVLRRYDALQDPPLRINVATVYGDSFAALPDCSKIYTDRGKVLSSDLTEIGTYWSGDAAAVAYLPEQGMVALTSSAQVIFIDAEDYSVVAVYPLPGTGGTLRVTSSGDRLIVSTARGLASIPISSFPLPSPTITATFTRTVTRTPTLTRTPTPTLTPSLTPTRNPTPFSGSRRTFTAYGSTTLPGTLLCDQSVVLCTNGADADPDGAHLYTADTLAFYAQYHGRDSLDDAKMIVDSTVNYGHAYANAFWNGSQAVYGAAYGYPRADDVVAGELTHGVTQFESGLLYYYQSGAINDSFSDVWGEFVDLTNNHGNDSPSVRWLHGEDVSGRGANRDLKNPPTFGDPDRMTSSYYYRGSADYYYGEGDNGGVHTNSGVNNKAAYLITDGGTFNGYTIRGLGIPKAAAIYYEAQVNLLTSGSDYADLYNALFQACQDVIGGPEGVTASDCLEVREATLATEMNLQPSSGYNLEAPVCPSGTARDLTLFSDDLEAGGANWTFAAIGGTSAWEVADFYAVSGTHMLGGNDYYTMSDSVAAMAADVALPSGAVLHFAHAYGFEDPNWDGGVLEYSTDGGGSWSDAGSLFSAGRGYGGTIYNGTGPWANPLSGRNAFIGDSHGYVSTRYDLSSLAGQSVRFRWRLGTDGVVFDWGWFVDDVEIYTCVGAPGVPALVSPASNALVSGYTPTLEWGDAAYADHYDLQVSTASDFSALVVDEDVIPSTFTFAAPLADNSTFWWRVRTVNQLDQASAWSAVRTFRTSPLIPLLVAPTDAETLLASRPTFDWSDVAGASNYTLQVSTGSTFATTVLNQTVVPSTYTMTVDLSPKGALMYWRVRANSTTGSSPWSSVFMLMSANPPSIPSLVSPATNTLAPSYTPTLDWRDASPGLDHYQLQVAKNNAFAGPVVDDSSLAASTYVFGSSLDPNATYYWRVRAFNAIGQYSAWSGTWTFRTLMSAPVLANPTSAEALLTTRPTFDWDDVLGASGYTLQVSTAASFSSTVLNVTASSSTYALTADLNPKGALLYWRVRANGTNGPSAWSEVRSLTSANPPSLPAPLAPASGALVLSYTPTLDWKDSTGGLDHYQLQVAGNSGFSGPVVDDSSLTSSIFTFGTPLPANTTYWWRLRSYNAGGQYSAWSAPWTFRTVMAAPTLMSPADAGTLQTTRPTFDWADGTSPLSSYNLQVSTVNTFATTVLNVKVTTSSYLTTADLTPKGALFYWRVRSNGANGPSPWSSVWTFTSANPPSIPGLLAPANGALLPTYLPTLDWADSTPALDHYQLQVADNSTFVGPVVDDSGLTASTYAFVSPLASNMTYYWRVRSFNTLGQYSRWSGARTFRTLILAPVLSSPSDGELLLTTRPTFDWGDVAGASGYTLQVSTVGSFASTVLAKNVTASTYPLTADLAPKNATLYWRVRANGTNGPSPWSETRSLTSANPPSVPALLLPASNGLVLTYTPVLDWSDSTGGLDHYQVQIAADSGFGAIVQDATTATSSHQPSPALSPNTKYWWRVRSINAGGQYSLWSAARYFRTVILPPSGLTSADASLTPRPTFDWGDVSGATDYTIQVSTSNGYATTVVNATVALSQYTPASDLPLGTTLYWRVRANGANGPSDWANGASFPSPIPPSLPVPMLPASNQLIMMYLPTLDWADSTRGLDHYQLQVASDGAFASLVVDDATLSVSTYTFSSALSPNSVFWWRVRSWNASGQYSAWSTVRSFRTVMITPSIAAPEDGATVTTRLPLLDWGDVAGATSYTVQVTATGSFSTPIVNASSSTSSYTPTSYLPILKVLQVRVRANGPNGPTAWSPTVSFMVIP